MHCSLLYAGPISVEQNHSEVTNVLLCEVSLRDLLDRDWNPHILVLCELILSRIKSILSRTYILEMDRYVISDRPISNIYLNENTNSVLSYAVSEHDVNE